MDSGKVRIENEKLVPELRFPEFCEQWMKKSLQEVCDVKGGKRVPLGYSLQDKNNGYPYITVSDFNNGSVNTKSIKYVPSEVQSKIKRYTISIDDLYISVAGTLGIVGIVPAELNNANLTENANKLTNLKIEQLYLFYFLQTSKLKKLIHSVKTTSAQPKLAIYALNNFKLTISPSGKEQQKIANFLTAIDQRITLLKEKKAALEDYKKGLMQKIFSQEIRFVDDEGNAFPDWEKRKLIDVADKSLKHSFIDGDWVESNHIKESGIRLIQTGNVGVGVFKNHSKKYISSQSFDELKCKEVHVGDLLVCRLAEPAGRACVVPNISESKMITSVDVTILKPDESLTSAYFLALYLNMPKSLYLVSTYCGGSTRTRIARSNLAKIKVPLPCKKEQQKIANCLSAIDQKINAMDKLINDSEIFKKGLLQRMFV